MAERCYTYQGVRIPVCWGAVIYGDEGCNCPPRNKADEVQKLTKRLDALTARVEELWGASSRAQQATANNTKRTGNSPGTTKPEANNPYSPTGRRHYGGSMKQEAKRLPDVATGDLPSGLDMSSISYWRHGGDWWLYLPGGGMGNLTNHDVTEHEDGTITVSPSIVVTSSRKDRRRHGYLKRGVWEPCGDDIPVSADTEAEHG